MRDPEEITDTEIREFQRSGVDSLVFAWCTCATDGNDAERKLYRAKVAALMPALPQRYPTAT